MALSYSYKERRKQDNENERRLRPLADAIYHRIGYQIERRNDKDSQIKGIDFVMDDPENPGKKIFVDEKAATSNKNGFCDSYHNLKTFCFETHTIVNKDNQGWLFASNSETTHYMLMYPRTFDRFLHVIDMELFLIEKKFVLDAIKPLGISCAQDAKRLLDEKYFVDDKGRKYRRLDRKAKLMYVETLEEKPLLILLNRDFLKEHSIMQVDYSNVLMNNSINIARKDTA